MTKGDDNSQQIAQENESALACQRGEFGSFDALYEAYIGRIYGFIYRRVFHKETAEDLTSETFLKALERIGSFNPEKGSFGIWIYRIARNTIIDYSRTKKVHADIEDMPALASKTNIVREAEANQALEEVMDALRKIKSEHREVLILRIWDGMSYKEIAEVTGMSEGNCKQIASRILRSLRSELGPSALALLFFASLWKR